MTVAYLTEFDDVFKLKRDLSGRSYIAGYTIITVGCLYRIVC